MGHMIRQQPFSCGLAKVRFGKLSQFYRNRQMFEANFLTILKKLAGNS